MFEKYRKYIYVLLMFLSLGAFVANPVEEVQSSVINRDLSNVNYAEEVIYQIVTDRFRDGDPSNNPEGDLFSDDCSDLTKYCGGDWQGIIDKIENGYLPEMGITTLWISPPVENVYGLHPEGFASYHGYWAQDFKKTNPFFGDFNDFSRLIETAHAHDIKIVIDFVPNHTSPVDIADGVLYDNGQQIGRYSIDPNNYFYDYGGSDFSDYENSIYRNLYDLASLNQQNPYIDNYLKESIQLWLDTGIDGIRVDAVAHMPFGWQKAFVSSIYDHRPVFTFGEWFIGEGGSDEYHHFANNSGMSVLDFRYAQVTQRVFRDQNGTMYDINTMLESTENDYDRPNDQVTFIDNHDMDRFTREGESTRITDMSLAFLLTSRGIPTIYYGTESYMTGEGDPGNRKMMEDFDRSTTAYKVIQTLAPLRQENKALGYGSTIERWINDDVFIYERSFNGDYVMVAINKNLDQSYAISDLQTDMPAQIYPDVLGGLLDGQSLNVNHNGTADSFRLEPGEVSVWQYKGENDSNPTIGQVGPPIGKPGDVVQINGSGFGFESGTVFFNDVATEVLSWDNETIEIILPDTLGGKGEVTVINNNGYSSQAHPFELLTGKQESIRFVVDNAQTNFGERVYLVGNVPELGNWNPDDAVGPMFNQIVYSYPTWYMDVNVPAHEELEFKFIIKDDNGLVTWESGSNHRYTVREGTTDTVRFNFRR